MSQLSLQDFPEQQRRIYSNTPTFEEIRKAIDTNFALGHIDHDTHQGALLELEELEKGVKRPIGYISPGGFQKTAKGWRKVSEGDKGKVSKEEVHSGLSSLKDVKVGDQFHGTDMYSKPVTITITGKPSTTEVAYTMSNGDRGTTSESFHGWKKWKKIESKPEVKKEKLATKSDFDRGEDYHAQQVAHHTKMRDMHQEIANHISLKYGIDEHTTPLAKQHRDRANDHHKELARLERIKQSGGLMSINHLKVGDKFIAISDKYNSEGKEVKVRVTKVTPDHINYVTEDGVETSINKKTGDATGYVTYTHDFSKWKPDTSSTKSKYEDMPADKLLKELGVNDVSTTVYQAKRSSVFAKDTYRVSDRHTIDKIKALVTKHGKPTKITYESTATPQDQIHEGARTESEYSYHKGTSVIFHWGDKKERVF